MDIDPDKLLPYLTQVEEVAEDILSDKQQLIDLDRRRQKTREAISILRKDKTTEKTWVCFGNQFIKLPKQKTKKLLEKDKMFMFVIPSVHYRNFDELDNQISDVRRQLKPKVSKLRDMEKRDDIKGFNLNPLSKEDIQSVEQLI